MSRDKIGRNSEQMCHGNTAIGVVSASVSNRYAFAHDRLCLWNGSTEWDQVIGCEYCDLIAKVRTEYVNDSCVWGEGECVPECPSCKRMYELLAERAAGDREGQRDMLENCIKSVERLVNKPDATGQDYLSALRTLQEKP